MLHPATFDFPLISETVPGAWVKRVVPGDPALEQACIVTARRLVERGAAAISSTCGFFIRHQAAVAASVNVPVALSSLLLVPTLLRQLPPAAKLAVVTFDSTQFSDDMLGLDNPVARERVVIGGVEGSKVWECEMNIPRIPTGAADIEPDVAACIARLRAKHPEISAILFECTCFPVVASAIRRITGLPVFDITTLYRMTFGSVA